MTITELKNTLKKYFEVDQKIREEWSKDWDSEEMLKKVTEIDAKSNELIKKIVEEFGLITISKFGKEASLHAFILIQHMPKADLDFMKKYLKLIEENLEDISKEHYALLKDRVLTYQDKPQIYGTQLRMNEKSKKFEVLKVIDPKNLNKRRKDLGFSTIEEYLSD